MTLYQSLVQCNCVFHFFVITILLSNIYMAGFMSCVLCLHSCTVLVITNSVWLTSTHVESDVAFRCEKFQCDWLALMWKAMLHSRVKGCGCKTCCSLTMRIIHLVLEQSQHSYSLGLVFRLPPLSVWVTCSMRSKWWLHTQTLVYTSTWVQCLIPNHCHPQYWPILGVAKAWKQG